MLEDTAVCSVATLAKLFNITQRRVQQLANEGVFIRNTHGEYDFIASLRGFVDYLRAQNVVEDDSLKRERERLITAQAERIEQENAVTAQTLIDAHLVTEVLESAVTALSAVIDTLPGRLTHAFTNTQDPAEIKALVFEACRGLRQACAEPLHQFASRLQRAQALRTKTGYPK